MNFQASGSKGDTSSTGFLQIKAIISGQTYWLQTASHPFIQKAQDALLQPGEYDGTLLKDSSNVPYKVSRTYQLTYPDGKTEKFTVVGIVGNVTGH